MRILTTLAGAGVALAVAGSAAAATVTYTDRTAFNAAASPTLFEDFNGFGADTDFVPAPVVAGFMTLSGSAGATTAFGNNKVDVPPLQNSQVDVDGTASLNVFTQAGVSVFLTFSQALTAWGADFSAFNDGILRTRVFLDGVEATTDATTSGTRFIGFVSDTAFTTLEFRGVANDVFGVDNVAGASAAVPEPAAWALMIMGFGAAGSVLRGRRLANA